LSLTSSSSISACGVCCQTPSRHIVQNTPRKPRCCVCCQTFSTHWTGDFAVLTLLDLSGPFDTVYHATLLRRLKTTYGITGTALVWFTSYLHERKLFVRYGGSSSTPSSLLFGVPQGSVLGPILFLLYTADLLKLVDGMELHSHLYTDDTPTQIYGSCAPDAAPALQQRISTCVVRTLEWMQANHLRLNGAKTEQLWCSPRRQQEYLPNIPLLIGSDTVQPVWCVRNLGIYIDSDLSMRSYVSKAVSNCFAALRRLRSIRRLVSQPVLILSLVTSLIMTRLNYGSVTLAGLPGHLLYRLQSVLNAVARLVCYAQKYGAEVRQRHTSSPGPPLVVGSGKNTVSTGRTRFPLP